MAFILQDRLLTIRMIADEYNDCMVRQMVTQDLNLIMVCAKMVPKNVNDYQRGRRNEASPEMFKQLETEPDFLNRVITGDESCFF